MIDNKIIKVTKQNRFDMGWSILTPYKTALRKNVNYQPILINDIVRAITKSDKISIILSEACLASAIVKELEWVNKYISIELIAKDEKTASRYSSISFSSVKIDPNINFNYLSIKGSLPLSVMIDDGYTETSSFLKEIYFDGGNATNYNLLLSEFSEVTFIGDCFTDEYIGLYNECLNKGIKTNWVIDQANYSNLVFEKFNKTKTLMLVSGHTKNAVLGFSRNGDIKKVIKAANGLYISCSIEKTDEYLGELYLCVWQGKGRTLSDIEGINSIYAWVDKKIKPFAIEDKLVIKRDVQTATMSDFIAETFDNSETEKHNEYSAVAKSVEYVFELIPPTLPKNARYSVIYNPLKETHAEYSAIRSSILKTCAEFISNIAHISKLYSVCNNIMMRNAWLEKTIKNHDFKDFSKQLNDFKAFLEDSKANLLSYVGEIYSSLGTTSDSGRFDKFDAEIAGYEQTITEKQALVSRGIDVISNKRRIDILQKKINDLLALKAKFESNSGTRTDKALTAFLAKCEGYLKGEHKKENDDSLVNIVKSKEESKESLLELFASEYLLPLSKHIDKCLDAISRMCSVDIPDNYTVYDSDGKRMIVIEDIDEFYSTKDIQEKYKLNCVVRR